VIEEVSCRQGIALGFTLEELQGSMVLKAKVQSIFEYFESSPHCITYDIADLQRLLVAFMKFDKRPDHTFINIVIVVILLKLF